MYEIIYYLVHVHSRVYPYLQKQMGMEIQLPSLPISVTLVLLLLPLLFILMIKRVTGDESNKRLPPGPRKLPIIGNIHQLFGGLPHHVLRHLSIKHGRDLMLLRLGQIDHIIVSSREAAREIMKTHDLNFCSRPPLLTATVMGIDPADIAFSPYGSYWKQMRKICALQLLSPRQVRASFAIREEEISNLVKSISTVCTDSLAVNLTERLEYLCSTIISRTAFGSTCSHGGRYVAATKKMEELASGFELADLYPSLGFMISKLMGTSSQLKKVHGETEEIVNQIIKEHYRKREAKGTGQEAEKMEEDLIDVLLSIQEKGELEIPITNENIRGVILDMFTGGTTPASTTLGWTMVELMRHPEVMTKVQSEVRQVLKEKDKIEDEDMISLQYMKLVIKETLRLHPPVPLLLPRVCSESCTVMGYHIPAGSRVLVNAWAIGRDSRYWEDGECFRPERFDGRSVDFTGNSFDYMPFGAGRRACPGITFGMVTLELALANLLFYFDWELPGGMKPENLDMTEVFGTTAGRKSELLLIAKPLNIYC